jgi:hypothetical protein
VLSACAISFKFTRVCRYVQRHHAQDLNLAGVILQAPVSVNTVVQHGCQRHRSGCRSDLLLLQQAWMK